MCGTVETNSIVFSSSIVYYKTLIVKRPVNRTRIEAAVDSFCILRNGIDFKSTVASRPNETALIIIIIIFFA